MKKLSEKTQNRLLKIIPRISSDEKDDYISTTKAAEIANISRATVSYYRDIANPYDFPEPKRYRDKIVYREDEIKHWADSDKNSLNTVKTAKELCEHRVSVRLTGNTQQDIENLLEHNEGKAYKTTAFDHHAQLFIRNYYHPNLQLRPKHHTLFVSDTASTKPRTIRRAKIAPERKPEPHPLTDYRLNNDPFDPYELLEG